MIPVTRRFAWSYFLHHREKLTPWLPEDAQTRELSCLLQHRRTAVDLRTLLRNMLRATRSRVIIPRPSSWPARISLPRLAASFGSYRLETSQFSFC
jgi:transposase